MPPQMKPKKRGRKPMLVVIGPEIRRRRLAKAWSRQKLAKVAELSHARIQDFEADYRAGILPKNAQKLADALDCDVSDITTVVEDVAS